MFPIFLDICIQIQSNIGSSYIYIIISTARPSKIGGEPETGYNFESPYQPSVGTAQGQRIGLLSLEHTIRATGPRPVQVGPGPCCLTPIPTSEMRQKSMTLTVPFLSLPSCRLWMGLGSQIAAHLESSDSTIGKQAVHRYCNMCSAVSPIVTDARQQPELCANVLYLLNLNAGHRWRYPSVTVT
jgi:hypothetical protein